MKSSRLTIKGQITIPNELRDVFGWAPHGKVEFQRLAGGVKVTSLPKGKGCGEQIVGRLRGSGNRKWSAGRILAWTRGEQPTESRRLLFAPRRFIDAARVSVIWNFPVYQIVRQVWR